MNRVVKSVCGADVRFGESLSRRGLTMASTCENPFSLSSSWMSSMMNRSWDERRLRTCERGYSGWTRISSDTWDVDG